MTAIVDDVIKPVFKKNYELNSIDTWNIIKENILEKDISISNPTFLIRATIPILLSRLVDINTKEEAKHYLGKLIKQEKGLPSSSDVFFENIRRSIETYNQDDLIDLIKIDINKFKVPSNIFVVILLFELMKCKNSRAEEIFFNLLENEKYFENDGFTYHTLDHFHIIEGDSEIQEKILIKMLDSHLWLEKIDKWILPSVFTSFSVAKAKTTNGNLTFLDNFLIKEPNDFYINLVFLSLNKVAEIYPKEIYHFIHKHLEHIDKIEIFIKDDNAREQIIEISDVLFKKNLWREAFWIIDKFLYDPDPRIDEEGDFNYHKKVEAGEDTNIITSVRGKIPWVLQKQTIHPELIKDIFVRVKILFETENLYVIMQSIIPLIEITKRRKWLGELDQKFLVELHNLLFELLHKYSRYPGLTKHLLHLFSSYRELNEKDAEDVLNSLGYCEDSAVLYIYFAIYRKDQFEEKGNFDSSRFEILLAENIRNGSIELRRNIAWHFWKFINKQNEEFEKTKKYIEEIILSPYNTDIFETILMIIKDNLENQYNISVKWFKLIIEKSIDYAEKNNKESDFIFFGDFEYIISHIAKKGDVDSYLEVFEKITILAQMDRVFIDLKEIFETYISFNDPEQEKQVVQKLESLWKELTKKNPLLIEIEWKEEK